MPAAAVCHGFTTRGLRLSSTIFIMICESERGRVADCTTPPDMRSGPRGRWPPVPDIMRLRNQYSSGIMSVPVGEPPTVHVNPRATSCPRRYRKSSACWRRKERRPDVAGCNELRRPIKLLPSSAHPPYCGSSSVVENHFEAVSDGIGFETAAMGLNVRRGQKAI